MRSEPQSYFHHPFSTLLGTEAAVRVLRELTLRGGVLTVTTLSRRTGLSGQAVRNVLGGLVSARLVRQLGQGRSLSYQLDATHPLAGAVHALFSAEARRTEAVFAATRAAAEQARPPLRAVWLYGSVARGTDTVESDLDLAVVAEEDWLEAATEELRSRLRPLEDEQSVAISTVPLSTKDVARLSRAGDPFWMNLVQEAVPLFGPAPEVLAATLDRGLARGRRKARHG